MYIFNSFCLLHSYNPSFLISLCFNMVSFRGQKELGPRTDRSPLGVFKISDEHPHPFHMRSPPPPPQRLLRPLRYFLRQKNVSLGQLKNPVSNEIWAKIHCLV